MKNVTFECEMNFVVNIRFEEYSVLLILYSHEWNVSFISEDWNIRSSNCCSFWISNFLRPLRYMTYVLIGSQKCQRKISHTTSHILHLYWVKMQSEKLSPQFIHCICLLFLRLFFKLYQNAQWYVTFIKTKLNNIAQNIVIYIVQI